MLTYSLVYLLTFLCSYLLPAIYCFSVDGTRGCPGASLEMENCQYFIRSSDISLSKTSLAKVFLLKVIGNFTSD